jgi:ectoine hydroxylase-related dioxygenase (phytanoyl-CoA dioxygenase family)
VSIPNPVDLRRQFQIEGYVHCHNFFSTAEMTRLQSEIMKAGESAGVKDYLDKGSMTFFSNVFRRSPYVRAFISQRRIVELLNQVAGPDFWVRWDQCVVKNPGAPEFPWHQDNAYNRLKDAHFQFWIALTAMSETNGGLWFQPGSHRLGLLPHVRVSNHLRCTRPPKDARLILAEKGDAVLFSSLMLHQTKPNESEAERCAYVVEYMSLDDYDPLVKPPYFIVSEGGALKQEFVGSYRGSTKLKNRIKYLPLRLNQRYKAFARTLVPGKDGGG